MLLTLTVFSKIIRLFNLKVEVAAVIVKNAVISADDKVERSGTGNGLYPVRSV